MKTPAVPAFPAVPIPAEAGTAGIGIGIGADAFWKVTSRQGPPVTEGPKLYIYRPAARPRVAFYRDRSWWDDDGEHEIGAPYCWANLDDLPRPPGER